MASEANLAHPGGPEGRAWSTRAILFTGDTRDIRLTLAYPKPDDLFDKTSAGAFNAAAVTRKEHPMFSVDYFYSGYLWQGLFGTVQLSVSIRKRQPGNASWGNIDTLFEQFAHPLAGRSSMAPSRVPRDGESVPSLPFVSQLNSTACVQWYLDTRDIQKAQTYYLIPFEDDYALQVRLWLVDNSTRPGLPPSDWLPRAQRFADQLVSQIKIEVREKALRPGADTIELKGAELKGQ